MLFSCASGKSRGGILVKLVAIVREVVLAANVAHA